MTINEYQQPELEESLKELSPESLREASAPKNLSQFGSTLHAKMWILPSGRVQPLNMWHWEWLRNNLDIADRFRIGDQVRELKQAGEQEGRIVALKAGFFRVNYEKRNGNLVVEGCAKYWVAKIKDAVFMLVADNSERIDQMTVSLFDDAVARMVKNASASLFRYDDREKLDHIPLVSESARGKALSLVHRLLE